MLVFIDIESESTLNCINTLISTIYSSDCLKQLYRLFSNSPPAEMPHFLYLLWGLDISNPDYELLLQDIFSHQGVLHFIQSSLAEEANAEYVLKICHFLESHELLNCKLLESKYIPFVNST